jgi:hypothetical protein
VDCHQDSRASTEVTRKHVCRNLVLIGLLSIDCIAETRWCGKTSDLPETFLTRILVFIPLIDRQKMIRVHVMSSTAAFFRGIVNRGTRSLDRQLRSALRKRESVGWDEPLLGQWTRRSPSRAITRLYIPRRPRPHDCCMGPTAATSVATFRDTRLTFQVPD